MTQKGVAYKIEWDQSANLLNQMRIAPHTCGPMGHELQPRRLRCHHQRLKTSNTTFLMDIGVVSIICMRIFTILPM